MTFETAKEIDKWVEEHSKKCKSKAFDGAQFTYKFTPTGIVECQKVTCEICKKSKVVYND